MRITAEHLGLWEAFVTVLPQPLSQADAERDRRAKAFIGMHCSDLYMFHVEQAPTAKAAWDALTALNAASTSARRLLLRQQMVSFKMTAREGVLEYFTRASQLRSDLAAAEEPLTDDQAVHMILAGLPARFSTTVQILQSHAVLSPTECLAKLLVAEQMLDAREEEPPTAYYSRFGGGGGGAKRRWEGASSRGGQQGGGNQAVGPPAARGGSGSGGGAQRFGQSGPGAKGGIKGTCWFCLKPGHHKAECWHWKRARTEQQPPRSQQSGQQQPRAYLAEHGDELGAACGDEL